MGSKGDADHRLTMSGRTIKLSEKINAGRIVKVSIYSTYTNKRKVNAHGME
jgi:hypothetical protein